MENNSSTLPTRNIATDLVNCKVLLNNKAMSGEYRLITLQTQRMFNRIASAKFVLADGDPAIQDFVISSKDDSLTPGATVEIQLGYHGQTDTVFKGVIVSHSIRSAKDKHCFLVIEAKDKAYKLAGTRSNHCFSQQKDSEMMEAIATKSGLSASDLDIASTTHQYAQMVQYNASPWDFILSRAEMNGMLVLTDCNRLVIRKPDTGKKPVTEINFGVDIISFESGIDARSQLKEVHTHAWNYRDQKVEDADGDDMGFKQTGNLDASDLADAIGHPAADLFHGGLLDDEELKAWGQAKMLKSRLAKVCGRISLKGITSIAPGQMVTLKGFSRRFNGPVLVTGITHQYDKSVWETEIQFGLPAQWFYEKEDIMDRPAAGLLPGVHGLQIGVVLQLEDDPDKQHRVRIQLPLIDAHEGVWARVASLDAGDGRGSFFRPELKDEVLVGFLQDDPRHPVILGMLNSSAKPAPIEAKDTNHEKGFVTRSGIKFLFNDEKKTVNLETPKGKKINIDEDGDSVSLADEHGNKITMTADGITIESSKDMNLKAPSGKISLQALNIEQKADVQFEAQGNAGAKLQSSGQTVVKGAIVNIN